MEICSVALFLYYHMKLRERERKEGKEREQENKPDGESKKERDLEKKIALTINTSKNAFTQTSSHAHCILGKVYFKPRQLLCSIVRERVEARRSTWSGAIIT